MDRHDLKGQWTCKYDNRWAKYEDPDLLKDWFN